MKFCLASSLFFTVLASTTSRTVATNPNCKVSEEYGYGNCRTQFYVNAPSSDVLWCISEEDCLKVFPLPAAAPVSAPVAAPVAEASEITVDALAEAISSSTIVKTSGAALLAAVSAFAVLC